MKGAIGKWHSIGFVPRIAAGLALCAALGAAEARAPRIPEASV